MKSRITEKAVRPLNNIMDIEEIRVKIKAKQEMINIEKDQTKKNILIQDLSVLQMRLEMEKSHDKIKRTTNSYKK